MDQYYYNQLHKIYEHGYNGHPGWLDFHEHIHLCEFYYRNNNVKSVAIDYRERAGPITGGFDSAYLANMTTDIRPGTVYIEWAELGKTPYHYWLDNEPSDLAQMCQLSKPWLRFRPKLLVSTQHVDLLADVDSNFCQWWKNYEHDWCKHWNIEKWPIEFIKGVIHVGDVKDLDTMLELFHQQILVERISLK